MLAAPREEGAKDGTAWWDYSLDSRQGWLPASSWVLGIKSDHQAQQQATSPLNHTSHVHRHARLPNRAECRPHSTRSQPLMIHNTPARKKECTIILQCQTEISEQDDNRVLPHKRIQAVLELPQTSTRRTKLSKDAWLALEKSRQQVMCKPVPFLGKHAESRQQHQLHQLHRGEARELENNPRAVMPVTGRQEANR